MTGDLGLTAKSVENELGNKFHLASTWDCVLLLDEADVFLAQRTKQDLQRNALVSGEHENRPRFLISRLISLSVPSSPRILYWDPIPHNQSSRSL